MKIVNCVQGSPSWLQERNARVTASRVADALGFLKRGDKQGAETAGRASYKTEIVSEILTGFAADHYVSPYMVRGTEQEPFARAAYGVRFDVDVEQVGFVIHPTIDRAGCSPDGLLGSDGGVEFKNPKTERHLQYMLARVLPPEYEPQVMWNMACTERAWWDFVSFDSRMPLRHQLFRVRVERNDKRIAEMEAGVVQFLAEVDEVIARLESLNPETFPERLQASLDETNVLDADIAWWYANTPVAQ